MLRVYVEHSDSTIQEIGYYVDSKELIILMKDRFIRLYKMFSFDGTYYYDCDSSTPILSVETAIPGFRYDWDDFIVCIDSVDMGRGTLVRITQTNSDNNGNVQCPVCSRYVGGSPSTKRPLVLSGNHISGMIYTCDSHGEFEGYYRA